jgi:hypothetical protein
MIPLPASLRRRCAAALFLLSLAAGPACGQGALDQVGVRPACSPGEPDCPGFDAPLAVGSVQPLDLDVEAGGAAGLDLVLESALPEVAAVEGRQIVGKQAGMTAVLVSTQEGVVVDFVHVWTAEPTRLGIHELGGAGEIVGPLQLLVGDEIELMVAPYADDVRLVGLVEGEWTLDGDAAQLLQNGVLGQRRLVARQPGSAELAVVAGDRSRTVPVEVLP